MKAYYIAVSLLGVAAFIYLGPMSKPEPYPYGIPMYRTNANGKVERMDYGRKPKRLFLAPGGHVSLGMLIACAVGVGILGVVGFRATR